jgi:hypothetical protein
MILLYCQNGILLFIHIMLYKSFNVFNRNETCFYNPEIHFIHNYLVLNKNNK